MRPSSKTQLLDAAVRISAREGIAGVTLEAVAHDAGLTKAGLLYHFRTKDALLHAVQQHLIDRLEAQLLKQLDKPLDDASAQETASAYARVIASGAVRRADLVFVFEAMARPELAGPWDELMDRWVPRPRSARSQRALDLFLACMAADGVWLLDATMPGGLSPSVRRALLARLDALVAGT